MQHVWHMSSEKESLLQPGLRFFADSNMWNVNWKP